MKLIDILAQRKRAVAGVEIPCTATEQTQDTANEERREEVFFPSLAFGCVADEFSEYF